REPALFVEGGEGGELEHSQRLPPELAHGRGGLAGDETVCAANAARGVPVRRGGNAEGVALGNRLAQQVEHRVIDARVLDAGRREQKLHGSPSLGCTWSVFGETPRRRGTHRSGCCPTVGWRPG